MVEVVESQWKWYEWNDIWVLDTTKAPILLKFSLTQNSGIWHAHLDCNTEAGDTLQAVSVLSMYYDSVMAKGYCNNLWLTPIHNSVHKLRINRSKYWHTGITLWWTPLPLRLIRKCKSSSFHWLNEFIRYVTISLYYVLTIQKPNCASHWIAHQ